MLVRVLQGVRRLTRDLDGILERELGLARQPVAQRFPVDERHREPEDRRPAAVAGDIARVVDREDVGVLQPRGQADLALEALGAERGGELGMQHLERDGPVVLEVADEIHRGHAAAPELALERVAVAQRRLQLGQAVTAHVLSTTRVPLDADGNAGVRGRRMRGSVFPGGAPLTWDPRPAGGTGDAYAAGRTWDRPGARRARGDRES